MERHILIVQERKDNAIVEKSTYAYITDAMVGYIKACIRWNKGILNGTHHIMLAHSIDGE